MSNRAFWLGVCSLVTVVLIAGTIAAVSVARYERDSEINAQTAIEQTRIEQEAKLERTRERLNWIPWYKPEGGE
ncbi:MAG: hypothetical protein ACYS7Y_11865 [Planctomycetota bacterium]|jgi:hypothetical protein